MASKSILVLTAPALALSLALAACGGTPEAEQTQAAATDQVDAGETIEARESNFKTIAKSMKSVKSQLDANEPDFDAISEDATKVLAAAQKVPSLFPAGTGPDSGEDTEALGTIWEKPEEFQAAAMKLQTGATKLRDAADSNDLTATKAAFAETGMACKGCHDQFREKKD